RTVSPVCCSRFLRPHHDGERLPRWLVISIIAATLTGSAIWLIGHFVPIPWGRLPTLGRRAVVWTHRVGVIAAVVCAGSLGVMLLFLIAPLFERLFDKFATGYERLLHFALRWRLAVIAVLAVLIVPAVFATKNISQELFPEVDSGEFTIHMRATG